MDYDMSLLYFIFQIIYTKKRYVLTVRENKLSNCCLYIELTNDITHIYTTIWVFFNI